MPTDIRATRRNPILAARQDQLENNLKAIDGGKPYIEARLSRHPCESETSWSGSTAGLINAGGMLGRKDRSFFINYSGRIARKICQLVNAGGVQRDGIGEAFAADTTATGLPIQSFMDRASEFLTAAGWCWIGVDRQAAPTDVAGNVIPRSQAAREASGDRVWWTVWRATEVVDWLFDSDGRLVWLITEQSHAITTTPNVEAVPQVVRTIWERGEGVRLYLDPKDRTKIEREVPFKFAGDAVPFTPVGIPSACPWWFDDVEMVCASLLNLESSHNENLLQTVFPQLVLPSEMVQELMQQPGVTYGQAVAMVRGLNYPILEPAQAKGVTRYLQPSAADMEAIPREIIRRRADLFEIVGMQLRIDTKQVESAEGKRMGLLDVSAVLAQRSVVLQAAETAAVALSKVMDPSFDVYAPVYPTEFDVGDIKGDLDSLLLVNSLDLPEGARREVLKVGIDKLAKLGRIPRARADELKAEADEADMSGGLNAFASSARQVEQPATN